MGTAFQPDAFQSDAFQQYGGIPAPTFLAAWAANANAFTDARVMKKNAAGQVIGAQLVSAADGGAFTGAVTVYVTGDGGAQAVGSVGAGACTHEGNGFHSYLPAQAETNFDHIAFTFIGASAVPSTVQTFPSFPQTGDNYARLGAPAGASVSADVAAIKAETVTILADTNDIQTRLPATLTAGGNMKADALAISGDTAAADNAEAFFDGTGYAGTNNVIPVVSAVTGLTAATVHADLDDIQARLPAALVGGRIDSSVGAMAANVMTAAAAAADLTTELQAGLATAAAVDDLPTNAELATALATADDAVLAQVALVKAKTDNLPAAPAATGDIPTATQNADTLLNRDMSAVSDTNARSPLNALRFIRNKWAVSGTTLSVKKEDDATEAWTATVTAAPGADPISGSDPA